jgi:photosystem II stability/assembly factor-like uncharacterized protein
MQFSARRRERNRDQGGITLTALLMTPLLLLYLGAPDVAAAHVFAVPTVASHVPASSPVSGAIAPGNSPVADRWISVGPTAAPHCGLVGIIGLNVDLLGPCSGRVTAITPDPTDASGNTIYVGGAQGGVWKTTDGGATWNELLDNPVQPDGVPLAKFTIAVGSITVTPAGVLYVGTGEPNSAGDAFYGAGILKSTDGGFTWTELGLNTFWQHKIFNVIVSPSNPSMILAAADIGLFSSADGGATWSNIGSTFPSISFGAPFTSLIPDPTNSSILYAAGGGEIFKSTDAGATWTLSTPSSTVGCFATAGSCSRISLAMAASSPSTVVAAASDGNLYRTIDSGATWLLVNSPRGGIPFPVTSFCNEAVGNQCTYDMAVAVDPTDPTIIYLGGQDLWVTFDAGNSWADIGGYDGNSLAGGNIHSDQHAVAFSPADHKKIFAGNDGGIWTARWHTRTIGGIIFPWIDLNAGLSITQFYSVAANPQELASFFGGTQDIGIVNHDDYSSVSHALAATTWDDSNPGDAGFSAYDTSNPTTQYAGFVGFSGGACSGSFSGGTCLLRRDTGSHCCFNLNGWFGAFQTSGFGSLPLPAAVDPSTPSTLYIDDPVTGKLFKSTDRGDNWSVAGFDPTTACAGSCGGSISWIAVAPSNGSFVYVGLTNGRFFASADGAASFRERDAGSLPGVQLEQIAVDPSNPNVVIAVFNWFANSAGRHVFVSRHAGDFSTAPSWADISAGLPDFPVHTVVTDPTGNGAIYVGTDTGVYMSTDSGGTWQVLGAGLPRVQVTDLVFSAGSVALVAATHGRGVWTISHLPQHPSTYVSTYTQQIGANAQSVEADCYPGDFTTGGGFEIPGGLVKEPAASEPNVTSGEPTGWVTRFGVGIGGTVRVFADCMTPTAAGGRPVSTYIIEADRFLRVTAGGVTASCNGSDPSTGGGFATAGSKVVRQSKPNVAGGTPTGWSSFFGVSADVGGVTVKSFAVCLSGSGLSTSVASIASSFGSSAGGVSVACPSGDAAVGGGFSFTGGTNVPLMSKPGVPSGVASGWFAFFGIGTGGTGTAFGICLTGGTSATVVCTPSPVLLGTPTTCVATVSDSDPSSSVTPTGPLSFTSDKPGSFAPSQSCNLGGTGSSANCSVQFTPGAGSVGAVSVTATYDGDSNHLGSSGSFSLSVFDFTVAMGSPSSTVLRGNSTTYMATTALVPGSLGAPSSVGLAVSGLPSDSSFTPSTLPLPGTGTVTIHTGSVSLGDFALTFSGTVQGGSRSATGGLHIYDFSVAAAPSSLQVLTTGSNDYSVSVQLVSGSSTIGLPTIALSVSGLPSGATGTFGPGGGTPGFVSTLAIATVNASSGTFTITIAGTDGRHPQGGTRSTQATLAVLAPAQALEQVINQVNDLHRNGVLNKGQANSLIVKLTHAIDNLNNRPDKKTACNQLSAFVHEVNAYVAAGILTPAQANALLGPPLGVLAIMAAIPC